MGMKGSARHSLSERNRRVWIAEETMRMLFGACALVSVLAVLGITLYMLAMGVPAILKAGLKEILCSTVWKPVAEEPSFGIFYVILTSIAGTAGAILLSVPVGVLTAVFLVEIAPGPLAAVVRPAVELLAAIPSVIYGMLGLVLLNPFLYRWEKRIFQGSAGHQFTGGANLLSAIILLAIMILPTIIAVSESALRAVSVQIKASSLALGASRIQTIFRVMLPSAKSGILTAVILGVGRAVGEAMAVSMVSGGSVNLPLPFSAVRFLTTAIVSEMGYASGLHREVLFTTGLVLFVFIILNNLILRGILRRGDGESA